MESKWTSPEMRPVYLNRQRYILNNALKPNVKDGKAWYGDAFDISENIGIRTNTPGVVVRRVLSKISPRNRWETSIPGAENLILYGPDAKTGTTNKFGELAYKMVLDHSLHLFDYKAAPKTDCFVDNMEKPNEEQYIEFKFKGKTYRVVKVTLDRHAIYSFGVPFEPNNKKSPNSNLTVLEYVYFSEILHEVAAEFGYLVQDAQAIIWLETRQKRSPNWLALGDCFI